ncbi:MAG TPA: NAD(+)/NADH kinase [Solirubrobacterales bacterium]|nr:NAD(+)/NADH kinase [Solirubrobacterales bacterium]
MSTAILVTHSDAAGTDAGVRAAVAAAAKAGWDLVATPEEIEKHAAAGEGLREVQAPPPDPDLCLALGGDGTILRCLRTYSGTTVPVFGINYGTIGFLAASESTQLADGLHRAFAGEYELLRLPGLEVEVEGRPSPALNDVSFTRGPHHRVAELSYRLGGREVGHVRCDGLVAATPVGSTGYNLANGGPILAWGVEGYVVSFIAPHTLTTRPLVVAPDDVLHVHNLGDRDPVEIAVDGVKVGALDSGAEIEVGFRDRAGCLAQLEGETFYGRIREKFGRLVR